VERKKIVVNLRLKKETCGKIFTKKTKIAIEIDIFVVDVWRKKKKKLEVNLR